MTNTPLSPEIAAKLEALRDIRLPAPVSWWPLAPGWWLLFAAVMVVLILGFSWAVIRRRTVKYVALRELSRLRALNSDAQPTAQLGTQIAALLRRVSLRSPGRKALAAAHGAQWLGYLHDGPHGMESKFAEYIAAAPYAPPSSLGKSTQAFSAAALLDASQAWIRRHA